MSHPVTGIDHVYLLVDDLARELGSDEGAGLSAGRTS